MYHNFIVLSIYTTIMSGNLKRKRCAYDTNFKLKVIQYSDECKNNKETSRKFNVSEKLVRDWKKAALDLEDLPRSKKARREGKPSFPQEEKLIKEWICEHRQQGYIVTRGAIHMKAKELIVHESFSASAGWCTRFMTRNKLVLRQKTKICQRLPADLEEKITSFQRFVIKERKCHSYPLSQIGNMDETPVFFLPPFKQNCGLCRVKDGLCTHYWT